MKHRDFKSGTLFVGGEKVPVPLFESFVELRPLLKHPCDGLFFFQKKPDHQTSVAKEIEFTHLVQTN